MAAKARTDLQVAEELAEFAYAFFLLALGDIVA